MQNEMTPWDQFFFKIGLSLVNWHQKYVLSNVSLGRKSAISLKLVLNSSGKGWYFQILWVPNLGTISNTFPDLNHRVFLWTNCITYLVSQFVSFMSFHQTFRQIFPTNHSQKMPHFAAFKFHTKNNWNTSHSSDHL